MQGVLFCAECQVRGAVGWGYSQLHGGSGIGPSPGAFKQQTIGLLHAMTYMQRALPTLLCRLVSASLRLYS